MIGTIHGWTSGTSDPAVTAGSAAAIAFASSIDATVHTAMPPVPSRYGPQQQTLPASQSFSNAPTCSAIPGCSIGGFPATHFGPGLKRIT